MGNLVRVGKGETFTITYQVDDACIDDVEVSILDTAGVVEATGKTDRSFTLKALRTGIATIRLYSRHDEDVNCTVKILVS